MCVLPHEAIAAEPSRPPSPSTHPLSLNKSQPLSPWLGNTGGTPIHYRLILSLSLALALVAPALILAPEAGATHSPELALRPNHLEAALAPFLTITPTVADYTANKALTIHIDNGGQGYTVFTRGHAIEGSALGKQGKADVTVMAANDGVFLALYNAYSPINTAKLLIKSRLITFHAEEAQARIALKGLSEGTFDDRLTTTPVAAGTSVRHDGERANLTSEGLRGYLLVYSYGTYKVDQWGAFTALTTSPRMAESAGKAEDKVGRALEECASVDNKSGTPGPCGALSDYHSNFTSNSTTLLEEAGFGKDNGTGSGNKSFPDMGFSTDKGKGLFSDAVDKAKGNGTTNGTVGNKSDKGSGNATDKPLEFWGDKGNSSKGGDSKATGPLTRLQVALYVAKELNVRPASDVTRATYPYNDYSAEGLTAEDRALLAALFQLGLFHGYPDRTFRPMVTLTPEEIAVLLSRLNLSGEGLSA